MKTLKQIMERYRLPKAVQEKFKMINKEWLQDELFYQSPKPNFDSPETRLLKKKIEELEQ